MANVQDQIAQAKAAGYSDADIAKHLIDLPDYAPKIRAAMDAGYKPEDIIGHLSAPVATEPKSFMGKVGDSATAFGAGLGAGVGQVALGAQNLVGKGLNAVGADGAGGWLVKDAAEGRAKLAGELDPYKKSNPIAAGSGEIGGNILATLPVGGVLGAGVKAVGAAVPAAAGVAAPLANALATGGMRAGAPAALNTLAGAGNMAVRMAGGAGTGAASAALVDPSSTGTSAVIGGLLPPALAGAGRVAGYAGRVVNSLVQPFTANGQNSIAGGIIRRFAEGGPTTINAAALVPGSAPTLAEATGNAGIAGLQRAARDMQRNPFVDREMSNSAARNAAFGDVAGDASKLDFFRADRAATADNLYGQAISGYTGDTTPYIKGQITQLLKRPSIDDASKTAQKWAIERGEKPSPAGSLQSLHDVKTALDDKISKAVQDGAGGEAKALQATKDKLLDVMEKMSPEYGQARMTYAAMSQPVNAMEVLQGLKLTDQRGNMTLQKVQTAIRSLQDNINAPGISPAKSLTAQQLATLTSIRDDLLRQSNTSLGNSAGSNTFQNIATNNILANSLPGRLGELATGKVGSAIGQVGRLLYSGPNEAIRNRLVDMMLNPQQAAAALQPTAQQAIGPAASAMNSLAQRAAPTVYRSAPLLPALSSSR